MEILLNLTQEQKDRLKNGQAVEIDEPTVGPVVVLLSQVYESITDAIQESELSALAKKAANDWARDNPY